MFGFVPAVGGFIGFVVAIWTFVAVLVAVRQTLDYSSTWRAFFVVLLSFIPVAILNVIVFLVTGGSLGE